MPIEFALQGPCGTEPEPLPFDEMLLYHLVGQKRGLLCFFRQLRGLQSAPSWPGVFLPAWAPGSLLAPVFFHNFNLIACSLSRALLDPAQTNFIIDTLLERAPNVSPLRSPVFLFFCNILAAKVNDSREGMYSKLQDCPVAGWKPRTSAKEKDSDNHKSDTQATKQ